MCVNRLALFTLLGVGFADAHVQFVFPPSRIDSDYQYTLDGTCEGESCDAFCGATVADPPATTVRPGPLQITINANVLHRPYKYRVSFSNGGDSGFDYNTLIDNIPNPNPNPGRSSPPTTFNVTVNIPDVVCEPTCTLHLYDYYHFVSCAEIIINDENQESSLSDYSVESTNKTSTANSSVSTVPVSTKDQDPILYQKDQGDTVLVEAIMTLPVKSWVALGLSPDGMMAGSRAVIGNTRGRLRTYEFDLNGRFSSQISFVTGERAVQSSFVDVSGDDGQYVHRLSTKIPKTNNVLGDICGLSIIWAHGESTRFGYHGSSRGVLGTVDCEQPSTSTTIYAPSRGFADAILCMDYPEGWHDSGGKEFDCERYAQAGCPDGTSYKRFGHTAQQACCACGGRKKGRPTSFVLSTTQEHNRESEDHTNSKSKTFESSSSSRLPSLHQSDRDSTILITVEVALPVSSWFAVGLSAKGSMVGSRAVIGNIGGELRASEFYLNGKFTEEVTSVKSRLSAKDSSFEVTKVDSSYVHRLTVTFSKWVPDLGNICGMYLIWAFADPKYPTTLLGYHGNNRGVLGKIDCEAGRIPSFAASTTAVPPETDHANQVNAANNTRLRRDLRDI